LLPHGTYRLCDYAVFRSRQLPARVHNDLRRIGIIETGVCVATLPLKHDVTLTAEQGKTASFVFTGKPDIQVARERLHKEATLRLESEK
jgi:hypothetical protein